MGPSATTWPNISSEKLKIVIDKRQHPLYTNHMTSKQEIFAKEVLPRATKNGTNPIISRKELHAICRQFGLEYIPIHAQTVKAGRGMFDLSHLITGGHALAQGSPVLELVKDERSDKEIEEEIDDRFGALDRMALGITAGKYRSLIASGNPGIGKTYTLEYILEGAARDEKIRLTAIRGYVKPTGLYRLLWETRDQDCVLMFDDADSVFNDEVGLNLLKGALDTTKRRTISWRSEKVFEDELGEEIPNSFDYNGSVVFVTNKDFDKEIKSSSKIGPHLEALISRSYYLDLNLGFPRELMVRVKSVVEKTDMLGDLSEEGKKAVVEYMEKHMEKMRELSLRMALKLAKLWEGSKNRKDFERMALATCLKREGAR
jgi:hypothetical protein